MIKAGLEAECGKDRFGLDCDLVDKIGNHISGFGLRRTDRRGNGQSTQKGETSLQDRPRSTAHTGQTATPNGQIDLRQPEIRPNDAMSQGQA